MDAWLEKILTGVTPDAEPSAQADLLLSKRWISGRITSGGGAVMPTEPDRERVAHVRTVKHRGSGYLVLVRCPWCLRCHHHTMSGMPETALRLLDGLPESLRRVRPACSALAEDPDFGVSSVISGFSEEKDTAPLPHTVAEARCVLATKDDNDVVSFLRPQGFMFSDNDSDDCIEVLTPVMGKFVNVAITPEGVVVSCHQRKSVISLSAPEGVGELLSAVEQMSRSVGRIR